MKLSLDKGAICIVHTNQQTTKECYIVWLKMVSYQPPRKAKLSEVAMVDLEPHTNKDDRMESHMETKDLKMVIGRLSHQAW